jgi:deoxyadenosine/deoxycytidine kinase
VLQNDLPFVLVAGNVGAGKSTILQTLAASTDFHPYLEPLARNPYFSDVYDDPRRWAFHSQLSFMTLAIADHADAMTRRRPAVQERGVAEVHSIFTAMHADAGHIDDRELEILERLYRTTLPVLSSYSLLIHAAAPVEDLVVRIQRRGRPQEAGLAPSHLKLLESRYEAFVASWTRSPLLRIDTSEIDVRSSPGREWLLEKMQQAGVLRGR